MKRSPTSGFTLIELLIVVSIVAILAAIAIPQFSEYRKRAYNSAAVSDMTNVRGMEEAMYAENQDYGNATVSNTVLTLIGATPGASQAVVLTAGVKAGATVLLSNGRNISYTAATKHVNGDSQFGAETETQYIYRKTALSGTNLQDSDIPAATQGADFVNPWAQMQ